MTLKEFLKHPVQYDVNGIRIMTKDSKGGNLVITDIRAWNAIKTLFPTQEECVSFQDELGKFIAEAIEKHKQTLK